MESSPFAREAEGISSALNAGRVEQAALVQLLLKKKIIQPEEFLAEVNELASDDYTFSVRRYVTESECELRNGRWHVGGSDATAALGQALLLGPDDVVLDIGCGIGGPARQLAELFGSKVVGVDIRLERVVEAILRTSALGLTSRVSFQPAEGEHLPFEDDVFDVVISQATLNRVPDKAGVIREAFRVLKPSGRFGFECEAETEKDAAGERASREPDGLFRILAWQQLLGASGFDEIEIEEMWEESRQFYPSGVERDEIERGERVNVRITARKP